LVFLPKPPLIAERATCPSSGGFIAFASYEPKVQEKGKVSSLRTPGGSFFGSYVLLPVVLVEKSHQVILDSSCA
jgi:hypothetical protein